MLGLAHYTSRTSDSSTSCSVLVTIPSLPHRKTTVPSKGVTAMVDIRISMLSDRAHIPMRMTDGSAGYDLYAAADAVVPAATASSTGAVDVGRCLVPLGLAIEMPLGTVGRIAGRSGLSINFNVEVGAGWIDSDFRGEVMVELKNFSSSEFKVSAGARIAQLILLETPKVKLVVVDKLTATSRGTSGMGSTGC